MTSTTKLAALCLAAAGAMAGAPASACDGNGGLPYVSGICITSWVRTDAFNQVFMPANGALLSISAYTQLYAVIGGTYGSATGQFALPNLNGRAVLGAGQSVAGPYYKVGAAGGQLATALTMAQLPSHQHTLNQGSSSATIAAGIGSLKAATTLSGLSATTSLSGVGGNAPLTGITYSSSSNNLNLMAAAAGPAVVSPGGKALSPTGTPVYSSATPGVAMASGSISGNLKLTVSANAPVTLSGAPTTTLQGGSASTAVSGAPAAFVNGVTSVSGSGGAVPTLAPYLALNYYIAYRGAMPVSN